MSTASGALMSAADRTKWNAKYTSGDGLPQQPSQVLANLDAYLPKRGSALDAGGGSGRNAVWLAQRGLDVTIWDISSVGLALARARAQAAGVSLTTVEVDLEDIDQLPSAKFDLIVSICYLNRPFLARAANWLTASGTLIVIQPTKKNLERHEKPPADFLLHKGELPGLVPGLDVLYFNEAWSADDRHDAVLVARAKKEPSPTQGKGC